MMYTKICPKCGKKFTTWTDKAKYCSAACRQSSFKERTRSDARAEREAEQQAEERKWKAEAQARTRRRRQEVEARAEGGDPMAIMETTKRTDPRYWDAWAAYEIRYAEEVGKTSSAKVNGFDVYMDHFGDEVVRSIEESGIITTGH